MTDRDTSRDVAIIGMACRFANSDDTDSFWSNLLEGRQCFTEIGNDRWNHDAFASERFREKDKTYVKRGAFIDDVDSFGAMHFSIAPRRLQTMDPQHRMVLETTRVALLDAGIEQSRDDLDTMGTFLGVSTSEYRNFVTARTLAMMMASGQGGDGEGTGEAISESVKNIAPISAFSMPGVLMNMAAANVANHWKLGGPAYTVDAACASSLLAVHDAVTHIRAGICRTAVAGGVYLNLTPEAIIGFSRIGAISQKGDCRPFDADADGFLQGDGCGVVVLKRFDDAVADGDRIYAVVRGTGVNNDAGQSSGPMAPSLEGQKGAVRAAIRDAAVEPHSIGFVSCHGTATPVGDPVEVGALRDVLTSEGELAEPVKLGSVKGNFGHTMSAAGVAGFMHAVLALHHEKITPQAGYAKPHPDLGLGDGIIEVPTAALDWKRGDAPRRAGVSSFGFGGTNVHVVLEEAPNAPLPGRGADLRGDSRANGGISAPHTFLLRADSRRLLADYAELLADDVETSGADPDAIAYTLSTRRVGSARLAIVASTTDELAKTLRRVAPMLRGDEAPGAMLGPDAFFGEGETPKLAFMFPGQGAQRLGLFRELTERYPSFAAHLDRLGAAAALPIRDLLYPETEDDDALARLTATEVCQPVMAAVGLALAAFLGELGVQPDVSLGHSLGEFAAASAGGMLSDEDAVRFVAERGRLMAGLEVDDFGAMAAVMAAPANVEPRLVEGAQVANLNHPTQTVISGATTAVEETAAALESADVKVTMLRVSHAFHSPVVAPVKSDLADVVAALELSEPTSPVVSAITGARYGDVASTRDTWVEHTTSAVDFMTALRVASEDASLFLEVGAGGTLCAFAKGTLDEIWATRSLGPKKQDDGREFQRALALLAASGIDIAFEKLLTRRVTSLVAPPLERMKQWVIRDKEAELDVPPSSLGGATVKNDQKTDANPDLVALFREQNEILRQHAAIIAAQTAALGGQPTPAAVSQPVASAPPVETAPPAPKPEAANDAPAAAEPTSEPGVDYAHLVRDAVASVSAFPLDALTDDQQLAVDLGFDSLMFVDLASDLQKRVPGLEIPQAAFDQSTSIADVIAFLEENAGGATNAAELLELGDVQRFRIEWQPVASFDLPGEPFKPEGTVAITTIGADDEALILAKSLEARGVKTRVVDLDDTTDLGDARSLIHLADRDVSWTTAQLSTLRQLAVQLQANGPEAFVTVTSAGADAATRGAQRGFAKALGREWPDARTLGAFIDDDIAATLLRELDDARHFTEVKWIAGDRFATRSVAAEAQGELTLTDDDVVVVTGGAKGIARACVEALADKTNAKFILVGRSKRADLGALKKRATYVSWDVATANPSAFGKAKPTVVVHAAGVIRDAAVQNKTDDDVQLVAGVKVDGLRNVLDAAGNAVHTVLGFGSWAGRFGNAHQCDYAAANDAMTEMLTELADSGVRAVNLDWPVWDDSSMGDSIPQSLKDAMLARGVTFLSREEGTSLFLDELGAADRGEVLYGRSVPTREAVVDTAFVASLDTMPYVADHVVRGAPIVPMAGALDMLASAAVAATDSAVAVRDLTLFKGLDLSEPTTLSVQAEVDNGRGQAEVHQAGELAYRAKFVPVSDVNLDALRPELRGDAVTPKLDLKRFYDDVAFHGPRIHGITKVEGIAPEWIVGMVKTSTPESLGVTARSQWTVDPLVVDAAMQLVLYHLQSLHGFGAIPMGIDEYVQTRPFEGDWVRCSMALDDMSDGNIVGTIAFEDEKGLAAVMTRLRAKEFHDDKPAEEPQVEVDPKHWDISKWTEVTDLEQRLQMADLIGIRNPYFWTHDGPARNTAIINGQQMLNYSSYNYCGFSGHPEVSQAAKDAVERYGTSVSASRIASGQIPLHQELEDAISSFIGTEATLVFSAGHMTNETVIGHVFGKNDLIIHDSLAHNSILTGAELSGAKRMSFPHSDWEALDRTLTKLRGNFEKVGIFIEGVYSMDGDIPELAKFIEVKKKHRALLYVDEAHSIGVIGPRGAGISDYFGIDPMEVDMWMGTLSKSFASCGGYITGSKQLIQYLKYTAPAFVFSAGISPANAAAANAACRLLMANPEIPQTLQKRAAYFVELCKKAGIDTGMSKDSAVVPAIVGNSIECLKLSANLADRGINVQPIVYPAVDDDASRLRFFLSAVHTEENLRTTVDILAEELHNVRQSGAAAE